MYSLTKNYNPISNKPNVMINMWSYMIKLNDVSISTTLGGY